MKYRSLQRLVVGLVGVAILAIIGAFATPESPAPSTSVDSRDDATVLGREGVATQSRQATDVLAALTIRGRAPKTGYAREQFGAGWDRVDACDMRQYILSRDLTDVSYGTDGCTVQSGTLDDPYTGQMISFRRGSSTSSAVQIDHVVALSDAWQKGAQQLDELQRAELSNDPLNLLAVDGKSNQQKSDSDAASWLPSNRDYRCRYVARQLAVKQKYNLWVTQAEHDAIDRVLRSCPNQQLPIEEG